MTLFSALQKMSKSFSFSFCLPCCNLKGQNDKVSQKREEKKARSFFLAMGHHSPMLKLIETRKTNQGCHYILIKYAVVNLYFFVCFLLFLFFLYSI